MIAPRDLEDGSIGAEQRVQPEVVPILLRADRRSGRRPARGEFVEDRLDRGFGSEFAVMSISGDDELSTFPDRECDAVLVGIGIGIGLARAAPR